MNERPPGKRPPKSRTPVSPRDRALKLLGRREHSAKELALKLKRQPRDQVAADTLDGEAMDANVDDTGNASSLFMPSPPKRPTSESVNELVADLAADNLQSNLRFAMSLVRRRAGDGYGPMRVRMELKSHGVSAEDITKALAETDVDWLAVLHHAMSRRSAARADRKERMKLAAKYQQRGFASDMIRQALKLMDEESD